MGLAEMGLAEMGLALCSCFVQVLNRISGRRGEEKLRKQREWRKGGKAAKAADMGSVHKLLIQRQNERGGKG